MANTAAKRSGGPSMEDYSRSGDGHTHGFTHEHAHRHAHSNLSHNHLHSHNVKLPNGTQSSGKDKNDAIQDDDSMEPKSKGYNSTDNSTDYKYGAPPTVEQKMRRELKFFFMNPYEKYKARGRKPWKLGVQIIKIILVTVQLLEFGRGQFTQVTFFEDNEKAFNNIFLKDWDPMYDSFAYPETRQLYALYEKDAVYAHLDYAVYKYSQLEKIAVGTFEFESRTDGVAKEVRIMTLCNTHYLSMNVTKNNSFNANLQMKKECCEFPVSPSVNISVQQLLEDKNLSINFDSMITLTLEFSILSLHIKDLETFAVPDCVKFDITILYDYSIHGGRIAVTLSEEHSIFLCSEKVIGEDGAQAITTIVIIFDFIIMALCTISLLMCVRSLQRGRNLKKKTKKFFVRYYSRKLSRVENLEFLNFWYIMIIISDLLTISGSIFKLLLEWKVTTNYDACSLLLGTGCLLVWLGILRYLGFFPKYNIPIVTLKSALPNCMRFMVCGLILYLAYAFSGYIVLGPYHHKFRTFNVAIECMYSLINGDDMFATFDEMSEKSLVVWYYSRVYLYTFISLFIYVILSLFIALIMDTYETVKASKGRHRNHTELEAFIDQCEDPAESGCYRRKQKGRKRNGALKNVFNCCRRSSSSSDETTPLLE